MFGTENANDLPLLSDRGIEHGTDAEGAQIGFGKIGSAWIRQSIVGGDRMFFAGECAEVERVVRDREGGIRPGGVRASFIQIDLGYGEPVLIEEPNAGTVHLQEVSARGGNGLKCGGQISAGQRVIMGEGSQGILVLL
jgi:hypothetical protein